MKAVLPFVSILFTITVYSQTSYYIDSPDGTKLHIREFGNGEPIVLLAGGPGMNPDYLEPVWKKLSSSYKCVIIDQRGTGKSIVNSVDSISMSMENYINDLEALRKHLLLDKLTLIGHSWGSMLSMEYTSTYPEKVKKLILLNTGGISANFWKYFPDNIESRLHDEDKKLLQELECQNKPTEEATWPAFFFNRARALELRKEMDFDATMGQEGVMQLVYQSYFSNQEMRMMNLKDYNGAAVIIAGRQDPIGESTFYEIIKYLPQTKIHFIEKCGHFPWLENEEQATEFFSILSNNLKNY